MAKKPHQIRLDPGFWTTTSWIQLMYGIWVNMAQLGIGLAFGFPAVQVPQLSSPESNIKITRDEASWIASVLTLFSPIGCLLSGFLMDKYGRRIMLIMCQGPMCIGWLFTGLAMTSNQIIIGRAITGIGCGMAMGPPRIFATEISLPNMRGVIGAFPALAMSMGISMQAGLGYFFAWKFLCFVCCGFTFCNLLVFNLLPETPYFILVKGTTGNARKALAKFRGKKYDVDSEMTQLIEFKLDNQIRKLNLAEEMHVLLSRASCKPFSLINTYILISQASGISVILMWAIEILKTSNSSFDVHTGNFLMAITRLVVGTFTSFLLFRVGRKPLAVSSAVGVSLVCFSLGLFIHYNDEPSLVPQLGFMLYMAFASLGYYTLPFMMMTELYPLQIRGTLGGITVSFASIFIFGTSKIFPYIRDSMGLGNTIVLFGLCSLLGTFFLYFFLPETKELTLPEIEEYYNARRPTLVSQRRIMTLQMLQHSNRSLNAAKSKSEILKTSKEKMKALKTDNTASLNMFQRDEKKSRSALLRETLKKTAPPKRKYNDKVAATSGDKTKLSPTSEVIKSKVGAANKKGNLAAGKEVKKTKSQVSFQELRPTSSRSSIESLHKYMEQDSLYKSKENIHHSKKQQARKFKDFDKSPPEKKLMIHSDESLSFYLNKTKTDYEEKNKNGKSPEKKPSSKKEQSLSIGPDKDEQVSMKEQTPKKEGTPKKEQTPKKLETAKMEQTPEKKQTPEKEQTQLNEQSPMKEKSQMKETSPKMEQDSKLEPSTMKNQNPDTETGPKKEQGYKQDQNSKEAQIPESDIEFSSLELTSTKQNDLNKSKESQPMDRSKDTAHKKVSIDSQGELSDSDTSAHSDNSVRKKKTKGYKLKERNSHTNKKKTNDDIDKPSTSKSSR